MSNQPRLSILIVTYRAVEAAIGCLRSLTVPGSLPPHTEIILVDSDSRDGTAERLAEEFPEHRLVRSKRNRGFAHSVNLGLSYATGEQILLLNPDTLVPPGSLERMLDYLEANPEIGALTPRVLGPDSREHIAIQHFPSPRRELSRLWEHTAKVLRVFRPDAPRPQQSGPVDWASGACLLMRREAIAQVGNLDERFFLYFEETDWCARAWALGWEVHFFSESYITHIGGASAQASGPRHRGRIGSRFRTSRRRYFAKHYGPLTCLAVELMHCSRGCFDLMSLGKKPSSEARSWS